MNLFELFIKIGVDDQASKKLSTLSSKLGNGLKTAAKIGTAAVAAAGTAIVAIGKQAIDQYAEYEQLVGGVETLFKQSADTVMGYAENAYKTAGLSANEYMNTVTSFSASLLQSLGGDTEAAVKYADMAITDMSDNANKMGTSMEMIQNAYQGFSKQNYTMLDNLKLGYGGTKEEMQRLLEDAEKLSGIEYDISSYADIVDAIHVVQTEMGITGTTAKEASTTIQGSINSAKAAWQNWLTALGDSNADIQGKTDELVSAIGTAAENILPVIGQVLSSIGQVLATALPELLSQTVSFVISNLPQIVILGVQLVFALIEGLGQGFEQLISMMDVWAQEAIVTPVRAKVEEFKTAIQEGFETAKSTVLATFESIKSGIAEKIDAAREKVHEAIEKIKSFFDFSWELPPLKLPHISISGKFSLNPPSVPSFGIEWYKNGGILNDPTIFGFNPLTGNAMVGGEAGAEAIAPIDTLQQYISEAVTSALSAVLSRTSSSKTAQLIEISVPVELDGAVLARKLYKYNLAESVNHGTSLINA